MICTKAPDRHTHMGEADAFLWSTIHEMTRTPVVPSPPPEHGVRRTLGSPHLLDTWVINPTLALLVTRSYSDWVSSINTVRGT